MNNKVLDPNAGFYEKRKKILWVKEICPMVNFNDWIVWMNDEDFVELVYQLMLVHLRIEPKDVLEVMYRVYLHHRSIFRRSGKFRFNDSRKAIHAIEDALELPRFNRKHKTGDRIEK